MDTRKSMPTYYGFILVKKVNGTVTGRYPVTKKECTFGRDSKNDIRILLESVSAQHCIIICVDDKAYIRDKSVAGSTKVNGKKIGRNNFLLRNSDEIEISGRKFEWEYANTYVEFQHLSDKKSLARHSCVSPKGLEHPSIHVNTPLDTNKNMKTPTKSNITKTPVVTTASKCMSNTSFDELKNNVGKQNLATQNQSERHLIKSLTKMTPKHKIPNIDDSRTMSRKSWVVSNASDNLSSSGIQILDKLSSERLKRDSTPVLSSSYHYEEDDVQFDSPKLPCDVSNFEDSVQKNTSGLNSNDLSVNGRLDSVNEEHDNNCQSGTAKLNNLTNSEFEPSTSRRDTYSVNYGPIVVEQNNTTPVPRRSILKCSKTARPARSRSSCRMVQFARLPRTDSKIKNSKSRIYSGSNFVVVDDNTKVADTPNSSKNGMHFYVEDNLDDDLDGVQPLDSSVSSLINSPILDNSTITKSSSKRGSRGNKVMNLVSSFEKRTNESHKNSIRASDVLSMNGSKHENSSPNNSQEDISVSQESISSSRRINLVDILEADSFRNESSGELSVQENGCDSVQNVEKSVLNDTDSIKPSNNLLSKRTSVNANESEHNVDASLNLQNETSSSTVSVTDGHNSTFVKIHSPNKSPLRTNAKLSMSKNCKKSNKQSLKGLDCMNNTKQNGDEEMHNDNVETHNNVSDSVEKSVCIQNDILELIEKCFDVENNHMDVSKMAEKSVSERKNHANITNNDSKLNEKSINVKQDHLDVENNELENTINEETPSMVIQCMSEMFNASIDKLEVASSQRNVSEDDSFVVVEKCELQQLSEESFVNKANKVKSIEKSNIKSDESLDKSNASGKRISKKFMDAIEKRLTKIHGGQSSDSNNVETTIDNTNNDETITSDLGSELIQTKSLKINNDLTKNSMNTSSPISISNSGNALITDDEDTFDDESISLSKTIPYDDLVNKEKGKRLSVDKLRHTLSEQLIKSVPSKKNKSTPVKPNRKTRSSTMIAKVITVNSESCDNDDTEDDRNLSKSKKNFERTLNSSIGKPQYESSPRNDSKSSKLPEDSKVSTQLNETVQSDGSQSSSKLRKRTQCDSTLSAQPNETVQDDVSEDSSKQRKRSRSTTPFPDIEVWSQMMKDFNESVKKASVSQSDVSNVNNSCKVLFGKNTKPCSIEIKVTTEKNISPRSTDVNDSVSKIEKNNIQHSVVVTPCSPDNTLKTSNEFELGRRSARSSTNVSNKSISYEDEKKLSKKQTSKKKANNVFSPNNHNSVLPLPSTRRNLRATSSKNESLKKHSKIEKNNSEKTLTNSESETDSNLSKSLGVSNEVKKVSEKKNNSSPELLSGRRNLRTRSNKKELTKSPVTKNKNNSKKTFTDSDSESSFKAENLLQTSGRRLRGKDQVLNVVKVEAPSKTLKQKNFTYKEVSINTKDLVSNVKSKKKNTGKIEATGKPKHSLLSTRTRSTRSSTTLIELSTTKIEKKNKTPMKKTRTSTKVTKTVQTKKSTLKGIKKSQSKRLQPIKTNKSDSSEYETMSETEDSLQKSQLNDDSQKTLVHTDKNSSLPEKIETPANVSSQLITRSRKRAAETSIISQPNTKGRKRDVSSNVASSSISSVSVSPLKQLSPVVKRTRNMCKSKAVQNSNHSFPETSECSKKEKTKSTENKAKKRELSSEDSSLDTAPSARKLRRNASKNKESEVQKCSSSVSKSKLLSQDSDTNTPSNNTKVRFNENILKKSISPPRSKNTRRTKQAIVSQAEKSPPLTRVLRGREKKK